MAENSSQYPIGTSKEYIRNVKGIYSRSIDTRNEMLSYNPLERRYSKFADGYSMVEAPEVGEPYAIQEKKGTEKGFLDNIGGLVGYTYGDGYMKTDNYKVISSFEEIERHQGILRFREPYLYKVDLPVDINREYFDYSYLKRLDFFSLPYRERNVYGNAETFQELNEPRHVVNEYTPGEETSYVNSKSKNSYYSTDEAPFYPSGYSVDTQSYSKDTNGFIVTRTSDESLTTIKHGLYEENSLNDTSNGLNVGQGDEPNNRPGNDTITALSGLTNDSNSLISKTNDLFRRGKINSMINRFYLPNTETNELQRATNGTYGISRGRNLLRKNNEKINSNGYEDPYCRVWTSHYQYSKYKNAIRPFMEGNEVLSPVTFDESKLGIGFRPFKKNRLMSTIDETNGLPIIAPKAGGERYKEDIKRCMFSIENLAWRDINFNTEVLERTDKTGRVRRGFDNVLSREQQGPNGGRIMWFPPYNLKFTENVGVNWNGNSFIGRGEQIYTYVNTDRTGTLDFTLLIDHPSILDRYTMNKNDGDIKSDEEILRFFAGCEILQPLPDLGTEEPKPTNAEPVPEVVKEEPPVDPVPEEIIVNLHRRLYAFFPNNFSGSDHINNPDKAISYLRLGGIEGSGYEGGNGSSTSPINGCIGVDKKSFKNKAGGINTWHYEVDDETKDQVLIQKSEYDGQNNYQDTACFGLNNGTLVDILTGNTENTQKAKDYLRLNDLDNNEIVDAIIPFSDIDMIKQYFAIISSDGKNIPDVLNIAESVKIRCVGFASKHGDQIPKGNERLALNRAKILQEFLIKEAKFDPNWFETPTVEGSNMKVENDSVSSIEAKLGRHAAAFIDVEYKYTKEPTLEKTDNDAKTVTVSETLQVFNPSTGEYEDVASFPHKTSADTVSEIVADAQAKLNEMSTTTTVRRIEPEYDSEYRYFQTIYSDNDVVKRLITDKVQYFDPAYHSITPEGFNARLTFLQQCTRQGPTVAASEKGAVSAGNLAFGRPPVCVLRIGDFYNTRIIIDSISINYDSNGGTQWDMNTEGIGLQPMFANVTIGFKFLGGSDLSGPISRLQNAVSYNFYANTSVYDRHADYRRSFITKEDLPSSKVRMWEAGWTNEPKGQPEDSTENLNNNQQQ